MRRVLPHRTGDPTCFPGPWTRPGGGPLPRRDRDRGPRKSAGPAAHNDAVKKRHAAVLLVLGAAALILAPRLKTVAEGDLTDARGTPMFFVGSGGSLGLVKGTLFDPRLRRERKPKETPRTELEPMPELKDALSGLSGASGASIWGPGFSPTITSARRRPDGSVKAGPAPEKIFTRGTVPRLTFRERRETEGKGKTTSGNAARSRAQAAPVRTAATPGRPGSSSPGLPERRARGTADFDGRRTPGSSGRLTKGTSVAVTPWSPKPAKKEKEGVAKEPKPPTLSDWIGKGAIKAPTGKLEAPSFSPLRALFPERLPDGRTYERATPAPAVLETLTPPEDRPSYADWLDKDAKRGRKAEPHWHMDGKEWVFHAGKAWGLTGGGRWTWMLESGRRWWTVADGAQRMVRHQDSWWWKTKDGWFLLKGGEPWAWRHFPEWEGDGVIHPTRGTQVVYSADGERVAVITPGQDTLVFDARTGGLLARFPPEGKKPTAPDPALYGL